MISLNYRRKWKHGKPKTGQKKSTPCPTSMSCHHPVATLPPCLFCECECTPQQTVQSRRPLHYEGPPPSDTTFGSFFIFFFSFSFFFFLESPSPSFLLSFIFLLLLLPSSFVFFFLSAFFFFFSTKVFFFFGQIKDSRTPWSQL